METGLILQPHVGSTLERNNSITFDVENRPQVTFDFRRIDRALHDGRQSVNLVPPRQARKRAALLGALFQAGLETARMTDVERLLAHEINLCNDWVRIDVQTFGPGLDFEDAWSRRETIVFGAFASPFNAAIQARSC